MSRTDVIDAVEAAVDRFLQALSASDLGALQQVIDRAEFHLIGNDPGEDYGPDPATSVEVLKRQFAQSAGRYHFRGGNRVVHQSNDWAWVLDRPTVTGPEGEPAHSRLTAVLRYGSEGWRLWHVHFSLGVDNDSAFGEDFPT